MLDIGPGPGVFVNEYAKMVGPEGRIVAIEKSAEAIQYALGYLRFSNVKLLCMDAEVPILDELGRFDVITMTDVLHHANSPIEVIMNVNRQATIEPRILISEFDPDSEWLIGPPLTWSSNKWYATISISCLRLDKEVGHAMIRILLVDDHPSARDGTKFRLEEEPGMDAIALIQAGERFSIMLFDLHMPIIRVGTDTADDILPNFNILIEAGVSGFVSKASSWEYLAQGFPSRLEVCYDVEDGKLGSRDVKCNHVESNRNFIGSDSGALVLNYSWLWCFTWTDACNPGRKKVRYFS